MRFLTPLILLCTFGLSGASTPSSWNWHQQFPWVYSDAESDWHYWHAGTDGKFYLWKSKEKTWYLFDSTYSKWISTVYSSTNSSDKDDSGWDWSKDDSKGDSSTDASSSLSLSLSHGGLTRTYLLYVPSSYDGKTQLPLLFNFHGFGGTSSGHMYASDMRSLADQENFILVYPQGSSLDGYSHWNAALAGGDNKSVADDVGFFEAMITSISSSYQVDPNRIYACGYSNGGFFSYFLAGHKSDVVAAVGSVSGTMLDGNPTPANPVPTINLHGTSDSTVPYTGNSAYTAIPSVASYWASQNGAGASPVTTNLSSGSTSVEKSTYSDTNGTVWVEHYKVLGGGHVWLDLDINGSNTNQLIWDFFKRHALNGPRSSP